MRRRIARITLGLAIILASFGLFEKPIQDLNAQEATKEAAKSPSVDEELLSLDFEKTDIRDVIRVLSHKSGINMIVGQDVAAQITLQIKGVTWKQALDVILKTYNLTYKKEENLFRIMTYEQMRLEAEKIPLMTKIITLDFASVDEIKSSLSNILSSRGSMEVNLRTNSIIITDLPEKVAEIEEITAKLDTRTPQVMIEALIADVTLTEDFRKGFDWTIVGPDKGKKDPTAAGQEWSLVQDLSAATPQAAMIQFGKSLFGRWDLDGLINMWKSDSRVNILANPRVMTLDNITAQIELIEQIPYTKQTETDQGAVTSTSFKDAGIKLYVTPHVTTKEGYISMNIQVEHSFQSATTSDNQPVIDSRKAETNLMVKDGETLVIGGLRNKKEQIQYDKVPFLGDLPFLGFLFTKKIKTLDDVDLLIFVTPRMVLESRLTGKEQKRLEEFTIEDGKVDSRVKVDITDKTKITEHIPALKETLFDLRPPK